MPISLNINSRWIDFHRYNLIIMKYEVKSGCTHMSAKAAKFQKKSKSKAQRLAGKRIVTFYVKGEETKALGINVDPKKGYWS